MRLAVVLVILCKFNHFDSYSHIKRSTRIQLDTSESSAAQFDQIHQLICSYTNFAYSTTIKSMELHQNLVIVYALIQPMERHLSWLEVSKIYFVAVHWLKRVIFILNRHKCWMISILSRFMNTFSHFSLSVFKADANMKRANNNQ